DEPDTRAARREAAPRPDGRRARLNAGARGAPAPAARVRALGKDHPGKRHQGRLNLWAGFFPLLFEEGWRAAPGWCFISAGVVFCQRRGGVLSATEPRRNLRQHSLEVLHHVPVLEAHHLDSQRREERIPSLVALIGSGSVVRRPVELHGNAFRGAEEIQHVVTNAVLAAELPTRKLFALQGLP